MWCQGKRYDRFRVPLSQMTRGDRRLKQMKHATNASRSRMSDINEQPSIASDVRFIGGRELVKIGSDDSIEIFAILLKESIHKYGDSNIETALCYYEYGNALFRAANRRLMDDIDKVPEIDTSVSDKKTLVATVSSSSRANKNKLYSKKDEKSADKAEKTEDDDLQLSLELMENAWSILDEYQTTKPNEFKQWIQNQIPRYLIGIGEILSVLNRHADSVDAYTRALPYREIPIKTTNNEDLSIEYLRNRRLYTEVNVLIAEELLLCNEDEDVVTYETKSVLVKKEERVDFIQGYYDKARDELQETGELFAIDLLTNTHVYIYINTFYFCPSLFNGTNS